MAKPAEQKYSLDELRRYFDAICTFDDATTHERVVLTDMEVAGSRYATTTTIDAVVGRWDRNTGAVVWIEAAYNPNTNPELLAEWARSEDEDLSYAAAANPGLDADTVAQLWVATGRSRLLANPNVDPALLAAADHDQLRHAAANPTAPADVLERAWAAGFRTTVLTNPACPRDTLAAALAEEPTPGVHGMVVANACDAVQNPTLTVTELEQLSDHAADSVAGPAARRLQRELVTAEPGAVLARFAPELDVIDPLAELILAGGAPADAAAALLHAGFGGTVAELINCAHAAAT